MQPTDRAQLCRAVALCKAQGVRYYLLGNGSNILFADEGFAGVVIDISALGSDIAVEGFVIQTKTDQQLTRCIVAHLWNTACPVWNLPTASPAQWVVQCI